MNRRERNDLDRHITGNYGEDQFSQLDTCEHCGAPISAHPITPGMVNAKLYDDVCMMDYSNENPTPLPFEVRALTDDDKLDIQHYQLRLPRN